ncbi:MAG: hypothetical protein OXE94_04230 [Aestuariivita sp.]|nr:hypothetical protein [Aestuariivita sp.]MCY4202238.1 hypothetical protein [Aestuariivita sp.]
MTVNAKTFKSLTFFGKRFAAQHIQAIQEIINDGSGISRTKLAMRVANALKWHNPDSGQKYRPCLAALEILEQQGVLTLPFKPPKSIMPWQFERPKSKAPCQISNRSHSNRSKTRKT